MKVDIGVGLWIWNCIALCCIIRGILALYLYSLYVFMYIHVSK
jgi:hypothetical protein